MGQRLARIGLMMVLVAGLRAQEVETDRNAAFNLAQFQTFAVKVGTAWGNPASESAVAQTVMTTLEQKGWKTADEASCDALVVLHGAKPGKQTFRAFYEDWLGYGWHNVGAPALVNSPNYDYKPGTLVLDIFDAKSRQVMFRGVAQDLAGKSADDKKKIDKAIKKMLNNLPEGKSGGHSNQEPSPGPN